MAEIVKASRLLYNKLHLLHRPRFGYSLGTQCLRLKLDSESREQQKNDPINYSTLYNKLDCSTVEGGRFIYGWSPPSAILFSSFSTIKALPHSSLNILDSQILFYRKVPTGIMKSFLLYGSLAVFNFYSTPVLAADCRRGFTYCGRNLLGKKG